MTETVRANHPITGKAFGPLVIVEYSPDHPIDGTWLTEQFLTRLLPRACVKFRVIDGDDQ